MEKSYWCGDFIKRVKLSGCLFLLTIIILVTGPAFAVDFHIAGTKISANGYLNQAVSVGNSDEKEDFDTMENFRQAVMQALLELDCSPTPETRFFVSGLLNVDWAYQIMQSDDEWKAKHFDESKNELFVLSESYSLLKEAHASWMPGNFIFRAGKQIVAWGETDAIRITDQINPVDMRRGASDMEFETSIVPIWMLRTDYYPDIYLDWIYDVGLELIFNPNAQFIPNWNNAVLGADKNGVWAPYASNDRLPGSIIASNDELLEEPNRWNSDGYEYGARLRANIMEAMCSLSYFYGISNSPVMRPTAGLGTGRLADYEGGRYYHVEYEGYYPRYRFLGLTLLRDFGALDMSSIGISSPVVAFESLYGYDNTYEDYSIANALGLPGIQKYDEFRYSVGAAWKVRIPWLNPTDSITINPTWIHQQGIDYPSIPEGHTRAVLSQGGGIMPFNKHMYTISTLIYTFYSHAKWNPQIFWLRNIWDNNIGDTVRCKLIYKPTSNWSYALTAMIFTNEAMRPAMDNKDYLSFTAKYQF